MSLNSIIGSVAASNPTVGIAVAAAGSTSSLLAGLNGSDPTMQGLLTAVNSQAGNPLPRFGPAVQVDPSVLSGGSAAVAATGATDSSTMSAATATSNPFDPSSNPALAIADTMASQYSQLLGGIGQTVNLSA